MDKDFDGWNTLKKRLDSRTSSSRFKEREIRWCNVGMNVGYEIFGKGDLYFRPVLVLHRFTRHTFLAVPMSTKIKDNPYYYPLHFQGAQVCAVLDQIKTMDSKRLANRLGFLSEKQFEKVKQEIKGFL